MSAQHLTGNALRVTLHAATTVATAGANTISPTGPVGRMWLYDALVIQLNVTAAATEAGDTLDVFVDTSFDGGLTWLNCVHFPQLTGTGGAKRYAAVLAVQGGQSATAIDVTADAAANTVRAGLMGDMYRVRYTTIDVATLANLSFTFAVTAYGMG